METLRRAIEGKKQVAMKNYASAHSGRAKNLLTEEFPVTGDQVYQVKRTWFWEGDVNAFEGVGRFVLGLAGEISANGSRIQTKFRK